VSKKENKSELTYWNFVAIDGVIKNQLDRRATGCNTKSYTALNDISITLDYTELNHRTVNGYRIGVADVIWGEALTQHCLDQLGGKPWQFSQNAPISGAKMLTKDLPNAKLVCYPRDFDVSLQWVTKWWKLRPRSYGGHQQANLTSTDTGNFFLQLLSFSTILTVPLRVMFRAESWPHQPQLLLAFTYTTAICLLSYNSTQRIRCNEQRPSWYLCLQVITWRWPLVKAATCNDRREHELRPRFTGCCKWAFYLAIWTTALSLLPTQLYSVPLLSTQCFTLHEIWGVYSSEWHWMWWHVTCRQVPTCVPLRMRSESDSETSLPICWTSPMFCPISTCYLLEQDSERLPFLWEIFVKYRICRLTDVLQISLKEKLTYVNETDHIFSTEITLKNYSFIHEDIKNAG
jgi:hypothetical protein